MNINIIGNQRQSTGAIGREIQFFTGFFGRTQLSSGKRIAKFPPAKAGVQSVWVAPTTIFLAHHFFAHD
jgi:hypothetical protein